MPRVTAADDDLALALELADIADGITTVAVVSMPALGRRWWATRGGGAFGDGAALKVSAVNELSSAQLLWSGVESWDAVGRFDAFLSLARRCWRTRGVGDAWQYMLVAEGAAELAMDPEAEPWDLAADRKSTRLNSSHANISYA